MDDRNATLLRIVAACVGVYQACLLGASFLKGGPRDPVIVVLGLLIVAFMAACVFLIRARTYPLFARLFVYGGIAVLSLGYLRTGLAVQTSLMLAQILPLLVGALTLGRRAFWGAACGMAVMVLLGAWRDMSMMMFMPSVVTEAVWLAVKVLFGLMVGSLVLDRVVTSMHDGLRIAQDRSEALARTRDRLQLEMLEREQAHEQLIHSQKVEVVGRLAGGVAHDFNHLLDLVLGYGARARSASGPDELAQALDGIESAARRAAAVARKLLDFGRLDETLPEVFDARTRVDGMRATLRQVFSPSVRLEVVLPDTPQVIRLDPVQLELVLLNIAVNADQAMPDGGTFRLELRDGTSGMVEVLLSDTGLGMDEQTRRRCLDPFFTTKPMGLGTGLGLAVANRVIRNAGGDLQVDSAPGRGSHFRILLPRSGGELDE